MAGLMAIRAVICGGIGSGKSTAAARFQSYGATILHADDVARDVLADGTEQAAAVAVRWPEVIADGLIDRTALGAIVFADVEELTALESIVHPATEARLVEMAASIAGALLVEMPILRDWFEAWTRIVVDAPDELRLRRAMDRSGIDEAVIRNIMERQPTRGEWLEAADVVIDNSGDLDHLDGECRRVWGLLGG
jgi:dephospho-CoA kinase